MKEFENMSLKNKVLLVGLISTKAKIFRSDENVHGKNLPGRFVDWMYNKCGIKKQTTFSCKNLYKLMRSALKLMNCRVNMAYFIKKP